MSDFCGIVSIIFFICTIIAITIIDFIAVSYSTIDNKCSLMNWFWFQVTADGIMIITIIITLYAIFGPGHCLLDILGFFKLDDVNITVYIFGMYVISLFIFGIKTAQIIINDSCRKYWSSYQFQYGIIMFHFVLLWVIIGINVIVGLCHIKCCCKTFSQFCKIKKCSCCSCKCVCEINNQNDNDAPPTYKVNI